jgi:hypothetical protein
VLVVEDELRMAALLKRGLQEDGYVVDIAPAGTDAVWQAGATGGAGLGLSIVLAIARAHGGRAVAANHPRGGAVVRIELPVHLTTDRDEKRSNDRCPQPTGRH